MRTSSRCNLSVFRCAATPRRIEKPKMFDLKKAEKLHVTRQELVERARRVAEEEKQRKQQELYSAQKEENIRRLTAPEEKAGKAKDTKKAEGAEGKEGKEKKVKKKKEKKEKKEKGDKSKATS